MMCLIKDLIEPKHNLLHKPTAKNTLKTLKSTIKQIYNLAIENRVLDYNPADAIKIPKDQPEEHRRALTQEEQQWIIDTPHRAQTAAMIMMFAGLRRGELLALTWNDVDLVAGTIDVNKSVERVKNHFEIKNETKTQAGIRTVYIPQILV